MQYLAAVAEVFSVDLAWLATGRGTPSPWGTPGLEGEIDSSTRFVLDSLTNPEERELTDMHDRRLGATKFLGPLRDSMIDHVVTAFADALDERRSPEDMLMTMDDWRARNLRVVQGLDAVLAATWENALWLLGEEVGIEPTQLTVDQQTRFGHGLIISILALLPERELPIGTRIGFDGQLDSAG